MSQREVQYNDLLHALKVMRIVDSNTSKPRLFIAMWLLETNRLYFDFNIQVFTYKYYHYYGSFVGRRESTILSTLPSLCLNAF